jgi:aspartate/methionine/tyrosine aminotransferase
MRTPVVHSDVGLLKYAIREIVDVMQKLHEIDPSYQFVRENIGDPVAKGWPVPQFFKQILHEEINRKGDAVFGYAHSRGIPEVRKWIVEYSKRFSPSSTLDYEYVLLTNGLGAAIASLYHMLRKGTRILQPAPTYPSHSSMESFSAGADPLFYHLDPMRNWEPDLDHMESQIKRHPEIAGVLVINPNNPTGSVYSRSILEEIIQLAERYQLMILSDEIYFRMVYHGLQHEQLTELAAGRIPLILMRGTSKDVPWPGGRSGWLEFHNVKLDEDYRAYCEAVKKRVLMEVCATVLPQTVIPKIYDHPEFEDWIRTYNTGLAHNIDVIAEILSKTKGLRINRPDGAFYMMPIFEEGLLNDRQTLPIKNGAAREYIEREVAAKGTPPDKRFCYYLLAATGICVVPASGFFASVPGFRLTTLERDETKLKNTYQRLSQAVTDYLKSAS